MTTSRWPATPGAADAGTWAHAGRRALRGGAESTRARFERRDASTLTFPAGDSDVAVTVLTPRIVRVALVADRSSGGAVLRRRSRVAARAVRRRGRRARAPGDARTSRSRSRRRRSASPSSIARGDWLLREPADAGMSAEPAGDGSGRLRLRASLAFSGEQHFYGLGQGGGGLDRLGVTRQLWNTHIGHGPGSDMGVPLLVSSRGYALFFDNPGDAVIAVGRSDDGVRIAYTAETGRSPGTSCWAATCAASCARWPSCSGARRCRRAGRSASSSRRGTSTTRRSCGSCPAPSARSGSPATGSSTCRRYGEALGWNRGVGHLEFQPELWPDPAALLDEVRAQHFEVITHEYPVLHEDSPLFAEAESRGYLLAEGYERAARDGRELSPGPALHRLLQPGRPRVVVGGPSPARRARGGGLVARRRRGTAGGIHPARRQRQAPPQHLRSVPPRGLRRGRGGRPARPARVPALPVGGRGHAALRRDAAGRATSTTTSRRWRRRSRSG